MNLSEYLSQVERSLGYSEEQWMFEELPDNLLDTQTLTETFLESGGCAFGNPVFEKEIFAVLNNWLGENEDKTLKVSMYAGALLDQLPPNSWGDLQQWLTDYAQGNWIEPKYQNKLRCTWPGLPEEYLKCWNWPMFELASRFWENRRNTKEIRMNLLFTQSQMF